MSVLSRPRPAETIHPLENGDRLTRAEFERRYHAMPHVKKAELIKGVVYMPSPVNQRMHGEPHFIVNAWAGLYAVSTPGIEGGDNPSLRFDDDNEPQPDVCLFVKPEFGGDVQIDAKEYLTSAPEWVGEVAASSASMICTTSSTFIAIMG
jgi:hypothetical protein